MPERRCRSRNTPAARARDGIEVHDHQDDVGAVPRPSCCRRSAGSLSVAWKRSVSIAAAAPGCSRRMRFTRAMSVRRLHPARRGPRPRIWYFSRVQVFLAAGLARACAPSARRPGRRCRSSRRQRRREHEPEREARPPPPNCRYSGRMSGVLGQRFGRKKSRTGRLRQLGEVLRELVLGVAPGEVGVRLGEARPSRAR